VDNLGTHPDSVTLISPAPPSVLRADDEPDSIGHGIVKITSSRDSRIEDYKRCLLEASGRCFISGSSAIHLSDDSADLLARKLTQGVKIDLLIMSPDWAAENSKIFIWIGPDLRASFHQEIRRSIEKLRAMWQGLAPAAQANFRLKTYATVFPLIITAYEDGARGRMVTEITDMLAEPRRPRFTVRKTASDPDLFSLFKEKYESIWSNAGLTKDVLPEPGDPRSA
jgi:hypothetical protein